MAAKETDSAQGDNWEEQFKDERKKRQGLDGIFDRQKKALADAGFEVDPRNPEQLIGLLTKPSAAGQPDDAGFDAQNFYDQDTGRYDVPQLLEAHSKKLLAEVERRTDDRLHQRDIDSASQAEQQYIADALVGVPAYLLPDDEARARFHKAVEGQILDVPGGASREQVKAAVDGLVGILDSAVTAKLAETDAAAQSNAGEEPPASPAGGVGGRAGEPEPDEEAMSREQFEEHARGKGREFMERELERQRQQR